MRRKETKFNHSFQLSRVQNNLFNLCRPRTFFDWALVSKGPFVAEKVLNIIIAGKSHETEHEEDAKDKHATDSHDHDRREVVVGYPTVR